MSTRKDAHQPAIQVIERMFALLDALAAHQDLSLSAGAKEKPGRSRDQQRLGVAPSTAGFR